MNGRTYYVKRRTVTLQIRTYIFRICEFFPPANCGKRGSNTIYVLILFKNVQYSFLCFTGPRSTPNGHYLTPGQPLRIPQFNSTGKLSKFFLTWYFLWDCFPSFQPVFFLLSFEYAYVLKKNYFNNWLRVFFITQF